MGIVIAAMVCAALTYFITVFSGILILIVSVFALATCWIATERKPKDP